MVLSPARRRSRSVEFLILNNWSAEQALAVIELIDDLRGRICRHCQLALHELQREQLAPSVNAHLTGVDDPF
ncbi:hypothetical protein KRI00_33860 [Paraburkholderia fungorum]|nr:hypothetical protein [Paraburkholderia fungorum]